MINEEQSGEWIKRVLTQARSRGRDIGDVVEGAGGLFGSEDFTLAFVRVAVRRVLASLEDGLQGHGGLTGSGVGPGG